MTESDLRYQGWRVAVAGSASVFLASLVVYTFGVLLKPLSDEFRWSREAIASAYGMMALAAAVSAGPLGYLLDRFPPTRVIVPCLVLSGCAFASLSFLSGHVWELYAIFGVTGAAALGTSALAYSRAVSSWFETRRGMALALVVSGGSIGGLVHPPAAEALVRSLGWRGATIVFGSLFLVVGVPMVVGLVREKPADSKSAVEPLSRSAFDGLRSRIFWFQIAVLFCSALAQNAAIVHLIPLLTDRGLSAGQAAIAMSTMGGAGLIGRVVTGWLLDRYFAPHVSFVLLAIAATGTFILSDAQSLAIGSLAALCIGFGMGGESDVTPYLLSRYFGLRSLSTLYGFTWIATGLAGALGPVLAGRAFDTTGSYETLLAWLAMLTIGSASLMFAMPAYPAPPALTGSHP